VWAAMASVVYVPKLSEHFKRLESVSLLASVGLDAPHKMQFCSSSSNHRHRRRDPRIKENHHYHQQMCLYDCVGKQSRNVPVAERAVTRWSS
jgi:hypothetical protein